MVAIKTLDGRRSPNSSKPGGNTGPRGGTGKSNSPDMILQRLMERQLKLKKLISDARKKVNASKKNKGRA